MPSQRGFRLALAVSLAIHVLVFTLAPKPRYDAVGPRGEISQMDVQIVTREPQPQVETPPPTPKPTPAARPPPRGERHAPLMTAPPRSTAAPTIAVPVPQPEKVPTPAPAPPAPTFDMAAMIRQRQEQRREADAALARGDPNAQPSSSADPALANLNRNLATLHGNEGVGGIFQILHMGTRTGEFAFNGWRPDSQRQWREVIEVDAGQGGDLQLAMVRRMIELIRTHYTGDFNWESHRLQRVVVLSARKEDQGELEDFLMREFFGTPLPRKAG
jgi:outer membrane biosynthesis protein TonB